MRNPFTETVAEFLTRHINDSEKTQRVIAQEIGYSKPNIMTMIKQGRTRLPLDKIGPISKALEIDAGTLFYMVMKEYMPETIAVLRPILEGMELSDHEREMVMNAREFKKLEAQRIANLAARRKTRFGKT